jgi:chemotaxis protein histidine kinase CheA
MGGWADDPELVATFRAEVDERLASLSAGTLELERHPSPRQLVAGLFRDAHTVKGSARMLGATDLLRVAHATEDLLGALRDARLPVRPDLVNLLLTACDAMSRAVPGSAQPLAGAELDPLLDAMRRGMQSEEPVIVPRLVAGAPDEDDEPHRARGGDSVRVASAKVYDLLDAVGEAELDTRRVQRAATELSSLAQDNARWLKTLRRSARAEGSWPADAAAVLDQLGGAVESLGRLSRELREMTEEARGRLAQVRDHSLALAMVPVRRVTAGLPRLVRDVAGSTGKDVRLVVSGEEVELDKQVLDGVADALKHLVINAVDHGCETPSRRAAAGKPGQATVRVAARSAGSTVSIDVSDDGAGIDEDGVRQAAASRGLPTQAAGGAGVLDLIFAPGFSTAQAVTETSGRGVGLDVVRSAVEELGGRIDVRSVPGEGTTFTLTLPVTLGVIRCLIARLGDERYALPVPAVTESIGLRDLPVHDLGGTPTVVRRGVALPLLDLGRALGVAGSGERRSAVVVRQGERQVAWAVDRLEGELELVVKDLGPFLGRLPLVSGATIDGDGTVVCLVDLRELGEQPGPVAATARAVEPKTRRPATVLVVEDSVGVRELERSILEAAGYQVLTAVDGLDGAARLREDPVDLVVSDVEMPGLDGFSLTRTIRRTPRWEQVPVVIMTSRGDEADQRAGLEAGADAYLLKSGFDQSELVETVRRLVGR